MEVLKPGETKIIHLGKEGVGGYTWKVVLPLPAGVEVTKCPQQASSPNVPGAPGSIDFCIKSAVVGTFKIQFELWREWESNENPAQTKTVVLEVK